MATAVYAGTFDPPTHGHLDVVRRGAARFDRLVVAVGARIDKSTLFSTAERLALLREAVRDLDNVTVEAFDGLVVEFAREQGASILLRGVRNERDYQYENQMALTNRALGPGVETLILLAAPEHAFVSSTLIREVLHAGGDVSPFVPPHVARALEAKRG